METFGELLLYTFCLLSGLMILIWSADKFIMGATAIAMYAQISPLIIGVVIVGFATSAPEYLVSVLAVINGSMGLSFGNVLGSNITNIGLGIGLPAIFSCIILPPTIVKREIPLLILSTILALFLLYRGHFSRLDAFLLLCIFFSSVGFSIWSIRRKYQDKSQQNTLPEISKAKAILWLCLGIICLLSASQLLVYSATRLAQALGVSDLVIGLTVIAIGTSLPEIASSCLAVIRREYEMALGNIIGSNLFNLLLVLGTVGVISPTNIPIEIILRDGITMLIMTLLLFVFSLTKHPRITRTTGSIFVCLYIFYLIVVVLSEKGYLSLSKV